MAAPVRARRRTQTRLGPQLLETTAPDPQSHVAAIRRGDVVAFERLFRALHPGLLRYVTHRTRSRAVAEELVQDVFVSLWQARHRLDPDRPIRAYLFRCARNAVTNLGERQRLDRRVRDWLRSRSRRSTPHHDRAATDELALALAAAIGNLPPRCREVFTLSRDGRLSYAEIADTLGLSTKTVENHMGRALHRLRLELRPFLE